MILVQWFQFETNIATHLHGEKSVHSNESANGGHENAEEEEVRERFVAGEETSEREWSEVREPTEWEPQLDVKVEINFS